MQRTEPARWRKSSYSNGSGGDGVELAHTLDAVPDSKNGAVLSLDRQALTGLVATPRHDG